MSDRGQSEVLGFAVVFGIIVISIGLLTATGYGGLYHAQESQRTNNAGTTFGVLAGNIDDLVRGAPSRSTEISLSNGRLSGGAPVTITVSGVNPSDSSDTFTDTVTLNPIVYADSTDTRFVYADGAVLRQQRYGTVVTRPPGMRLTSDAAVIPIVRTRLSADSPTGVGGSAVQSIRTRRVNQTLLEHRTGTYTVSITVTSPRAAAWRRTLKAQDGVTCDALSNSGDSVTCHLTTDHVTVVVVDVDVTFE